MAFGMGCTHVFVLFSNASSALLELGMDSALYAPR